MGTWTGQAVKRLPHVGTFHSVAFSPDGRWLVTSTIEEYRFWAVGTWERRQVIRRDWGLAGPVAFSRDGRMLALAHSRYTVRLYDAATFAELARLEALDPRHITWLRFTPAGGLLAATTDHSIQLWDLPAIRNQLRAIGLDWKPPSDRSKPDHDRGPWPPALAVDTRPARRDTPPRTARDTRPVHGALR